MAIGFYVEDDLLAIAPDRQQSGLLFSGVIYAHQRTSVGVCIADLELIAQVYDLADCLNQVHFLPF